jgi:hypothetical protein
MKPDEKQRLCDLAEELLQQQNFVAAVIAGAVAMILAAAIYGIAKSLWEGIYPFYSIFAAGIGLAVGYAMQFLGRGIQARFAVVAAIYAFIGCVLGNMLAVVMRMARATAVSPLDIVMNVTRSEWREWMFSDMHVADLMFWLIGIGAAAYFSRRPLTREEGLALYTCKASQ